MYVLRYLGQDELDPFFVDQMAQVIVNDPGIRNIGVCHVIGIRSTFIFAPTLSGEMSVENKLISNWQSVIDKMINLNADVIEAKRKLDMAKLLRVNQFRDKARRNDLMNQVAKLDKALVDVRSSLFNNDVAVKKIRVKMDKAQARIMRHRDQVHQCIADFVRNYKHILWTSFGNEKGMWKKKIGGLAGWWKNKGNDMAHTKLAKKVLRAAAFKGNTFVDPSEMCSTMLCHCGACTIRVCA